MGTIDTMHFQVRRIGFSNARVTNRGGKPMRVLLARVLERVRAWSSKRRSRNTLKDLIDAQLRDIGLIRDEAMREAGKSRFWN